MHIGHCKAAMLNFHYAKMYGGKMILRFDDTNPSNEKEEFVENIKADLKTLQIHPDSVTYTSDHFDTIIERMRQMIEGEFVYADNTPGDKMKEERDAGIESYSRLEATKEKTLEIFE